MLRRLLCFAFIFFCVKADAQRITVKEGLYLLGRGRSIVYDTLSARNYSFKSKSGDIETFERSKTFGLSTLNVGFKNNVLTIIGWSESILYSSIIYSEIISQGFEEEEEKSSALAFVFENKGKNLIITLINRSSEGYVIVNIGRLSNFKTAALTPPNKKDKSRPNSGPNKKQVLVDSTKQGEISPKSNKPKAIMSKHE